MRNLFASCNTYTFQMIQIKEILPLFVYFLIQFSIWEVKAAEDFDMPKSFSFKNKIHSIFAFSFCFPKDKSNQQRTYICLFVFCFKMRENPLHFPTLIFFLLCFSIKLALCLFHVHGLPTTCALKCPHYIKYSCCPPTPPAVAVCRRKYYRHCHCHQPVTAIVRIGDLLLLPPLCSS
jgi:hypothetical protein